MKIYLATALVILFTAGCTSMQLPANAERTITLHHPTLPIDFAVSTKREDIDFKYTLVVTDTEKKKQLFTDSGVMPPMLEELLYKGDGKYNFLYDLNFDGHKEFFLEDNNPMHYSDCSVYIFDEGNIVRQRLVFSEIIFDQRAKCFTCSVSQGLDGRDLITYKYGNSEFQKISMTSEQNK